MEIASDQFTRLGVRYVTMEDIAKASGVSKKTIYQEFKDKEELVIEAFSRSMDQDRAFFEGLIATEEDPIKVFREVSKYIRHRFSDINPLVLSEIQRYYPRCWKLCQDFKHNCAVKTIICVLERGKKTGVFRPEVNSEMLGLLRMNQISSTFDPNIYPPSKFSMVEVQMVLMDHFIHGILTDKGREQFYKINNQN
ncbi:TetR/AcrR family transcriptional regulator [Echinicola pacifica]|uniref:TetR/AcrR family transcriptional regulator n=1 Tax=Echinicola pacifica TaxID=346377 RepID=UPI001E314993|nr:TetR/AcrR family transcriptional regulator [Echinicola pacifica]